MAPIDLLEENSIEAASTHYESANIHILNNSTSSNQNETTRTTQPSENTNNANYLLKYNKNLNSTPTNNMSYDDACLNDSNNNSDLILKSIHLKLNGSNKSLNIDTSSSNNNNNNSEALNGHSHDKSNNLVVSDRDSHKPNDLYEQPQQQQPQPALLDNVYETYDEFDDENISSSSLSSSSLSPLSDAHSNRTNPNSNVSNCSSRDENDEHSAPQALNLFKLDMNSTSMNKLAKNDNDDHLGETCTNLNLNDNDVSQSVVSINENSELLLESGASDSNEKSEDGGSCISDSLTPTPTPNTYSHERFV